MNEWATPENDDSGEPNLHISGTMVKTRNSKTFIEFWMSQPRPKNVSIDEWEAQQEAKWERIFGRKHERSIN